jgi:hypothetical protein
MGGRDRRAPRVSVTEQPGPGAGPGDLGPRLHGEAATVDGLEYQIVAPPPDVAEVLVESPDGSGIGLPRPSG